MPRTGNEPGNRSGFALERLPEGQPTMERGTRADRTVFVARTADEGNARIAAIKANGGIQITVRIVKQDQQSGTLDVEISQSERGHRISPDDLTPVITRS